MNSINSIWYSVMIFISHTVGFLGWWQHLCLAILNFRYLEKKKPHIYYNSWPRGKEHGIYQRKEMTWSQHLMRTLTWVVLFSRLLRLCLL